MTDDSVEAAAGSSFGASLAPADSYSAITSVACVEEPSVVAFAQWGELDSFERSVNGGLEDALRQRLVNAFVLEVMANRSRFP